MFLLLHSHFLHVSFKSDSRTLVSLWVAFVAMTSSALTNTKVDKTEAQGTVFLFLAIGEAVHSLVLFLF